MDTQKPTELPSRVSLKESIATRLIKTGLLLYLLATVILTACHMASEYAYVKKSVAKDLRSLEKTLSMGLAKLIWEMDRESLSAMVVGIYETPVVVGLKIEINRLDDIRLGAVAGENGAVEFFDDKGKPAAAAGKLSGLFSHGFPLVYEEDGDAYPVGNMELFSSRSIVLDRIKVGFSFIIVNALLMTIFLCIIFFTIIQRMLARPLRLLTRTASSLDMDRLDNARVDIQTSGKTELKVLEQTFNQMIAKLHQNKIALQNRAGALEKELSDRRKAEAELQRYQSNLEELIENRTRELNATLKDLKESEARVTTILNAVNTGIVLIHADSRTISDINPVAARMIGLNREEIIGKTCHRFICPKTDRDCPIMDHGQSVDNAEKSLMTADGREIPILKTVVPIVLNKEQYLLESFVDLSERKATEAELNSKLKELVRFHQLTIDREHQMIALKNEINRLRNRMGEKKKYKIVS